MDAFYEQEEISPDKLQAKIFENLKGYGDKSFLEMFALYLGKAQLLEFALKKLLVELYGFELDTLERKTLGQTRRLLEDKGLRTDYVNLLKGVVDDRNHAAHEMLANQAILGAFDIEFSERFRQRELLSAAFKLEQSIILFDYFQHNNAWLVDAGLAPIRFTL